MQPHTVPKAMSDAFAPTDAEVAACIRALIAHRGPGKTICPSEVASALRSDWRPLMPTVRSVAGDLAASGELAVTQQGRPVDPLRARGPIRLGLPSD